MTGPIRLDIEEALRYMGAVRNAPESLRRQTESVAAELEASAQPRYFYRIFPLIREPDENGMQFRLGETDLVLQGQSAQTMLETCDTAAVLICTLGAAFETKLRAVQARDMAKAVILDACANALTEAGCNAAERELSGRFPGRYLTDRFSPGYGSVPLELQRPLCTLLDSMRRLGVQVTDSLLLNPTKSVTAFIGISDQPQAARIRGCAYCALRETCSIRSHGGQCGR